MNVARPVYIDRIAHASALGLSATKAAESLLAGKKTLSEYKLLGESWPWFALPIAEENWTARVQHVLGRINAELAAGKPTGSLDGLPLFIGSSANGIGEIETLARIAGATDPTSDDAAILDREIRLAFGCKTAPWMFSTACTSGMAALEAAFTLIAQGEIDEALVLGIDFGCNTTLAGFASLGLLAHTEQANGLILGEAAAGLLLTAQPGPGWRIAACRLCIDGYAPTMPTPDGRIIADNIAATLSEARFAAHTIELIKPHRSGLPAIDEPENAALDLVFASRRPEEISFKRQMGHTLGACGPAEITALLALLATPARQARQPHRLLFNFVGFGGSTAVLIAERCLAPGACS
jgi:3-oxoacyl-[acyl-carrier-protein] synthase-1